MAEVAKYITLTDETFEVEVIHSDVPVLVDFWAAWCGPCRLMNPIMDSLADTFEGKVKIAKLNIDDYNALATSYHIMGVPTLLFFKDGNLMDRTEGVMPEAAIADKLNALL
ncbi:thioredoxin [Leptolyngbya sp. PCC 6406]|uniref:thioredoxin n=1 Tax=Leptolyngbya sp. PCC 6406 TaxID=1173264 RepID=UPI0002AC39DC|nr:thioredoxin [Leptolyngbya sp. PCC 6406]